MTRSIDSLAESGLIFLSARSSFHSELAGAMANLDDSKLSSSEGSANGRSDKSEDMDEDLLLG